MPTPTSVQRGSIKKCHGQGWICTICPAATRGRSRVFLSLEAAVNHERTTHDHEPSELQNEGNAKGVDEACIPGTQLPTEGETCWDNIIPPRLTSEGLRQWEMHAHVDHVFDLVPFWQRGMDAAERGEVLRMEEFLEKMEDDGGWRTANDVLEMLGEWRMSPSKRGWVQPYQDDWAASQQGAWEPNTFGWARGQRGAWGIGSSARVGSDATELSGGKNSGWGIREEWANGGSDLKRGRDKGTRRRPRVIMRTVGGGGGGREELRHFVDTIAQQEAVNEERRRQMVLFSEMTVEEKIGKIEETIRFLREHSAGIGPSASGIY